MDLIKKGNKNEDIIDFLFEKGLSKTLGQLIKQLNQFFKLKESYRLELIEILKNRNYLIHYYFKNNINLFFSTKGKKEAISYFKNFTKRVIKMDEYLTSISFDYYQKFNINEELINSEFKKMRKKWRNY